MDTSPGSGSGDRVSVWLSSRFTAGPEQVAVGAEWQRNAAHIGGRRRFCLDAELQRARAQKEDEGNREQGDAQQQRDTQWPALVAAGRGRPGEWCELTRRDGLRRGARPLFIHSDRFRAGNGDRRGLPLIGHLKLQSYVAIAQTRTCCRVAAGAKLQALLVEAAEAGYF